MDIITLVAQTGGTLGLAIFAIWMLNRTWEDRLRAEHEHAENLRAVWEQTREALERNTEALVKLLERMDRRGA